MRQALLLGVIVLSSCGPPVERPACAPAPREALGPPSASSQALAAPPPTAEPPPPPKVEKLPPEGALSRLFTSKAIREEWFAKVFLDKVPAPKVAALVAQLSRELGDYQRVERDGAAHRVVFANGSVPSRIHLDGGGRVDGLFFGPRETTKARPAADVLRDLRALPGKISVLATTDGKSVAEADPDAAFAVGSAFKLAILAALKERVDAKKLSWTQVVTLKPENKSLPSGILQKWPDGAPITLHTVASLMISQSDNTATDVAAEIAGRAALERLAPGNAPFLTTREAFQLKAKTSAAFLARWRREGEAGRRKILEELRKEPLPSETAFGDDLMAPDVEWQLSARRLCELLALTKELPMFAINPGVATKKDWDRVAFKGGSEPGVLNLSTWVEKAGKTHCVVTTWNDDKPVDDDRLKALHAALLAALR